MVGWRAGGWVGGCVRGCWVAGVDVQGGRASRNLFNQHCGLCGAFECESLPQVPLGIVVYALERGVCDLNLRNVQGHKHAISTCESDGARTRRVSDSSSRCRRFTPPSLEEERPKSSGDGAAQSSYSRRPFPRGSRLPDAAVELELRAATQRWGK